MDNVAYFDAPFTHYSATLPQGHVLTSEANPHYSRGLTFEESAYPQGDQFYHSSSSTWPAQLPVTPTTLGDHPSRRSPFLSGDTCGGSVDLVSFAASYIIPEKKGGSVQREHHPTPSEGGGSTSSAGSSSTSLSSPRRHKTQLRTISRARRLSARKPASSPEEAQSRALHNQVEQQYRNRLNARFEQLLAVLPPLQPDDTDRCSSEGRAEGAQRLETRVSKADVLDLARGRIKALERERERLEENKKELLETLGRLQDQWLVEHHGGEKGYSKGI